MSETTTTTGERPTDLRAGRLRVSRSRGAFSGLLLVVLGAWAALIPFIGPYFDLAFTPSPNGAWHWTSGRGLYELLPGAVTVLGALLLVVSANRVTASVGGWLAVAGGAWLVVAPSVADLVGVDAGAPDPSSGRATRALASLLFFSGIGAAIVLVAALALGRLSVHSVRDVRAAEKRAAAEAAAEEQRQRAEAEDRRRRDEDERRRRAEADAQRQRDEAEEQRRRAEADAQRHRDEAQRRDAAAQPDGGGAHVARHGTDAGRQPVAQPDATSDGTAAGTPGDGTTRDGAVGGTPGSGTGPDGPPAYGAGPGPAVPHEQPPPYRPRG